MEGMQLAVGVEGGEVDELLDFGVGGGEAGAREEGTELGGRDRAWWEVMGGDGR